ncbi:MAG: hypothetical protein IPJ87_07230 [Flavobacteriales bacterium]|nr:hypothetical protein [Flavobacteriales bacterium]
MNLRILPLPLVGLAMLAGVFGGMVRLGWGLPLTTPAAHHGLLMTGGFLGTLIILERTVVLPSRWWRLFPLLSAMGTLLSLAGQLRPALIAMMVANLGLTGAYAGQMRHHRESHWYLFVAGALCGLLGNAVLWHGALVPAATPWWIAFILLTIVGERLELTRYLPVPRWAKLVLWVVLAAFLAGVLLPFHGAGPKVLGVATVATALWLMRYDMARVGVRKAGFHRYVAAGLLVSYGWLLLHGGLLLLGEAHLLFYDLYLHTFFLGFAFSMIWAHAPIILPSVLRSPHRPYHQLLWLFWALFQLTLLARILFAWMERLDLRRLFGVANGFAIVLMFAAMAVIMVMRARRSERSPA